MKISITFITSQSDRSITPSRISDSHCQEVVNRLEWWIATLQLLRKFLKCNVGVGVDELIGYSANDVRDDVDACGWPAARGGRQGLGGAAALAPSVEAAVASSLKLRAWLMKEERFQLAEALSIHCRVRGE